MREKDRRRLKEIEKELHPDRHGVSIVWAADWTNEQIEESETKARERGEKIIYLRWADKSQLFDEALDDPM